MALGSSKMVRVFSKSRLSGWEQLAVSISPVSYDWVPGVCRTSLIRMAKLTLRGSVAMSDVNLDIMRSGGPNPAGGSWGSPPLPPTRTAFWGGLLARYTIVSGQSLEYPSGVYTVIITWKLAVMDASWYITWGGLGFGSCIRRLCANSVYAPVRTGGKEKKEKKKRVT